MEISGLSSYKFWELSPLAKKYSHIESIVEKQANDMFLQEDSYPNEIYTDLHKIFDQNKNYSTNNLNSSWTNNKMIAFNHSLSNRTIEAPIDFRNYSPKFQLRFKNESA